MAFIPGQQQGSPLYSNFSYSQAPYPYSSSSQAPYPYSSYTSQSPYFPTPSPSAPPSPYYSSTLQSSGTSGPQPYSFTEKSYSLIEEGLFTEKSYSVIEESLLPPKIHNAVRLLTRESFVDYNPLQNNPSHPVHALINQLINETALKLQSTPEEGSDGRLNLCERMAHEIELFSTLDATCRRGMEMEFREAMMLYLVAFEANALGQSFLATDMDKIPERIEDLPEKLTHFGTKGGEFPRSSKDLMSELLMLISSTFNQQIQEHLEKPLEQQFNFCNTLEQQFNFCNTFINVAVAQWAPSTPKAAARLQLSSRKALTELFIEKNPLFIEKYALYCAKAFQEGTLQPEELTHTLSLMEETFSNQNLRATFIEKAFGTTDMEKLRQEISSQPQKKEKPPAAQKQKLWDRLFVKPAAPQQKAATPQQIEEKKQAQERIINCLTEIMKPANLPEAPPVQQPQPLYPPLSSLYSQVSPAPYVPIYPQLSSPGQHFQFPSTTSYFESPYKG